MTIGLEYMDRLSKQQKRLAEQRKRIEGQTRRGGEERRRQIGKARIAAQTERVLKQRGMERERALGARMRGEAVTGIDELEREKLSRQKRWKGKWDRRRAKWEARARKFVK